MLAQRRKASSKMVTSPWDSDTTNVISEILPVSIRPINENTSVDLRLLTCLYLLPQMLAHRLWEVCPQIGQLSSLRCGLKLTTTYILFQGPGRLPEWGAGGYPKTQPCSLGVVPTEETRVTNSVCPPGAAGIQGNSSKPWGRK